MRKFLVLFSLMVAAAFVSTSAVKADTATGTSFEVTKTATPSTVAPSATVSFTISIKNIAIDGQGQTPQTVIDTLPEGFTFANDSKLTKLDGTQVAFAPSSVSGQTVTWTFQGEYTEAIPENQNVVISYSTTASDITGTYENNACLTVPENVCTTATITVQENPQAGLKENIALGTGVAAIVMIFGILSRRQPKVSFEDAVLSSQR